MFFTFEGIDADSVLLGAIFLFGCNASGISLPAEIIPLIIPPSNILWLILHRQVSISSWYYFPIFSNTLFNITSFHMLIIILLLLIFTLFWILQYIVSDQFSSYWTLVFLFYRLNLPPISSNTVLFKLVKVEIIFASIVLLYELPLWDIDELRFDEKKDTSIETFGNFRSCSYRTYWTSLHCMPALIYFYFISGVF